MDKIFEPLISDMHLLGRNDGYTFTVTSIGKIVLRGAVLAFLADTPVSQSAGGFKEGFGGAKRKCRHCMATFETMQKKKTCSSCGMMMITRSSCGIFRMHQISI